MCVIHSIFGVDIRDTLLIMDEEDIQQIVTFVNQAMTDTRSKEQPEMKNCEAHSHTSNYSILGRPEESRSAESCNDSAMRRFKECTQFNIIPQKAT